MDMTIDEHGNRTVELSWSKTPPTKWKMENLETGECHDLTLARYAVEHHEIATLYRATYTAKKCVAL